MSQYVNVGAFRAHCGTTNLLCSCPLCSKLASHGRLQYFETFLILLNVLFEFRHLNSILCICCNGSVQIHQPCVFVRFLLFM